MPCRDGRDNRPGSSGEYLATVRVGLEGRLNRATRAACEMAGLLIMCGESANLSAATRRWIKEHQMGDANRVTEELASRSALIPNSRLTAASLTSLGDRVSALGDRITALEETLHPTKVFRDDLPAAS